MPQPDHIAFTWNSARPLREIDDLVVRQLDRARSPHTRSRQGDGYRYTISPKALNHAPAREITIDPAGTGSLTLARRCPLPHPLLTALDKRSLLTAPARIVKYGTRYERSRFAAGQS